MTIARIQILSKELNKVIQAKASRISYGEIEEYYNNNIARFEKVVLDRLYIPKTRQQPAVYEKGPGTADDAVRQQRSQNSEQIMTEEVNNLHARAVAGEEFIQLQADAYKLAEIKSAVPTTSITIRPTSLPANQISVIDLQPGEVSSVLGDVNGYVIYKVRTKTVMPLDQVEDEIKATLRLQHVQDELRHIEDSATPVLDEVYFLPRRPQQRMSRANEPVQPSTPHAGKAEE